MTHHEQLFIASVAAMQGLLSDPTELKRVRRGGRILSCSESVAVIAVRHAKSLLKEIEQATQTHET